MRSWTSSIITMLLFLSTHFVYAHSSLSEIEMLACDAVGDSLILVDLYHSTNQILPWDLETPVCTWEGVTCYTNGSGCVWVLNISGKGLNGKLPESIGNFSDLRWFNFNNNNIEGELPASIGNQTSMRGLMGRNNNITGKIPESIGDFPHLRRFLLSGNELEDEVPESFLNLSTLEYFDITSNNISKIPEGLVNSFPNMPNNQFRISSNFLTFDDIISNMGTKMGGHYHPQKILPTTAINCGDNSLNPVFDYSVSNTLYTWSRNGETLIASDESKLQYSDFPISSNNTDPIVHCLTATNPAAPLLTLEVCSDCPFEVISNMEIYGCDPVADSLALVDLFHTTEELLPWDLNTPISTWEGISIHADGSGCVSIVNLSDKNLKGKLPNSIGSIKRLIHLNINNNTLENGLPNEIGNLTNLYSFNAINCKLSGELPESMGQMTNLQIVRLQGNDFKGAIPASFSNLSLLKLFDIRNNKISKIPEGLVNSFSTMPNNRFRVSENYLTFDDIFPNMGSKMGGWYHPQKPQPSTAITCSETEMFPNFDMDVIQNNYNWVRSGETLISSLERNLIFADYPLAAEPAPVVVETEDPAVIIIGGATINTPLVGTQNSLDNSAPIHCVLVTNPAAPALTLKVCTNCYLGPDPAPDNDHDVFKLCEGNCKEIGEQDNGGCYTWTPEGTVENPNLSMIEVCPDQTTTYTLTISDDCGNFQQKKYTIEVSANKHIVELTTDPITFCPGSSTVISASASYDSETTVIEENINQYTYLWSTGATTSSISILEPGFYSVTATHDSECEAVNTIHIVESPINIYPTDLIICGDQPLAIELDYEVEIATIDWPSGIIPEHLYYEELGATPNNVGYTTSDTQEGEQTVKFVTIDGCTLTETIYIKKSLSHEFRIEAKDENEELIEAVCLNSTEEYLIIVTPTSFPNTTYNYNWSEDLPNEAKVTVTKPGDYSVTITEPEYGCEFIKEITIDEIELDLEINASSTVLCTGSIPPATILLTSSLIENVTTFTWSQYDGQLWTPYPVPDIEPHKVYITNPGKYKLEIETTDGCITSAEVTIRDGSNIDDLEQYFIDKGYYALPLDNELLPRLSDPTDDISTVPNIGTPIEAVQLFSASICNGDDVTPANPILDESGVGTISIRGDVVNLADLVDTNLKYFRDHYGYTDATGNYGEAFAYITSSENMCMCEDYWKDLEENFKNTKLGFHFHIHIPVPTPEQPEGGLNKLYILSNNKHSNGVTKNYPGIGDQNGLRTNFIDVDLWADNFVDDIPDPTPVPDPTSTTPPFTGIGDKSVFIISNALVDNYVSMKDPFETNTDPNANLICNNVEFEVSDRDYFAMAPTCCYFQLPNKFIPNFNQELNENYPSLALSGYTKMVDGSEDEIYRATFRGNTFTGFFKHHFRGAPVENIVSTSDGSFNNPIFLLGEQVSIGNNHYQNISKQSYSNPLNQSTTLVISTPNTCVGTSLYESIVECDLYPAISNIIPDNSVSQPDLVALGVFPFTPKPYQPGNTFAEIIPSTTTGPVYSGLGTVQPYESIEDGLSYIIAGALNNQGVAQYIQWNCSLGIWEEILNACDLSLPAITEDPFPENVYCVALSSEVTAQILSTTITVPSQISGENWNGFLGDVGYNTELTDPSTYSYPNVKIIDAKGFYPSFKNFTADEITQASDFTSSGLNLKYVLTYGERCVEDQSPQGLALDYFYNTANLETENIDLLINFHVNIGSNSSRIYIRFNDHFWDERASDQSVIEIPTEEKNQLKQDFKKIFDSHYNRLIRTISIFELPPSEPYHFILNAPAPFNSIQQWGNPQIWYTGHRYFLTPAPVYQKPIENVIASANVIQSHVKYVYANNKIDPGLWKNYVYDDNPDETPYHLSRYNISGFWVGLCEGVLETSEAVEKIQMSKFLGEMLDDPDGTISLLKQLFNDFDLPFVVYKFFEEKYDNLDSPDIETRIHELAKDAAIAGLIVAAKGKSIPVVTKQIVRFPTNGYVEDISKWAKKYKLNQSLFDDLVNNLNLNKLETQKLLDLGLKVGGNNWEKLLSNPSFVKCWRQYSEAIDFEKLLNNLPAPPHSFYDIFDIHFLDGNQINGFAKKTYTRADGTVHQFDMVEPFLRSIANGGEELMTAMKKPQAQRGYVMLLGRGPVGHFRNDPKSISKIADLLNTNINNGFLENLVHVLDYPLIVPPITAEKLIEQGRLNLEIIFTNRGSTNSGPLRFNPRCETCPRLTSDTDDLLKTAIHQKMLPDLLDDYANFVDEFIDNIPSTIIGADDVVRMMNRGSKDQIDEVAHIIREARNGNLTRDNVWAFDDSFPGDNTRFDVIHAEIVSGVKEARNRFTELKSYKESSLSSITSSSQFKHNGQFGNYLSNIESVSDLNYRFNKRKLLDEFMGAGNGFASVELAHLEIKRKFRILMGGQEIPNIEPTLNIPTQAELDKAQAFLNIMNEDLKAEIFGVSIQNVGTITDQMLIDRLNLTGNFLDNFIIIE